MANTTKRVLLTGVTGLVGGAIALELLRETDAEISCLARPRGDSAQDRVIGALRKSAELYNIEFDADMQARTNALQGDITEPLVGVDPDELGQVDEVWHVAASLAFEDKRAEEISLHNVAGTENVVNLAQKTGASVLNYISTAYVAGASRGTIHESSVTDQTEPNNHYERSKIQAERITEHSGLDVVRIFRPSIVIGHSSTYGALTFSGLYGFVRGLQRARNQVRASLGDLLKYRPLRLLADGDTPVNFIPVDHVARCAVAISQTSDHTEIYHLANRTPPSLLECWQGTTEVLGMQHPLFVDDAREFTMIDEKVDEQMNFYRSYMNDRKYFDTSHVQEALGDEVLSCDLSSGQISKYVEWYLSQTSK